MKQVYIFSCSLLIAAKSFAQVASCVHGGGIQYLLDAYSGSMGACNCQKASGFLFSMPPCNNGSYYLAFEDNFDGNLLDLSKWEIQPWGQGALQTSANVEYNSLDNAIISDGTLKITAKKENVTRRAVSWMGDNEILSDGLPNLRTYEYTSSNIWTQKKFFNGKYEIRARMPNGQGLWPAFWMFGGQRWNEIDVFDNYTGINTLVTSVGHDYDGNGTSEGCNQSFSGYDFSQWHTFTCIFDFDRIIWQIDGITIRSLHRFQTLSGTIVYCGEDIAQGTYFFQKSFPIESMSIILNLAIGSGNGPSPLPDASTPFPSTFEIDYVRFYIKSEDEPCDGCLDHVVYENTDQLPTITRASNYIQAGNNVTVKSGQNVSFKAPTIELLPGFSTESGATFEAVPEECNLLNYEDVFVDFIGSNAVDNYQVIKCINPVYTIEASGVLFYSFRVYSFSGQLIYSISGSPTLNYIDLWNTINAADGWYTAQLQLLNCSDSDIRDYNLFVTEGSCKMASNSSDSTDNPSKSTEIKPDTEKEKSFIKTINKEFVIYPNPAKDLLNIFYSLNDRVSVSMVITDINGREISREDGVNSSKGANRKTIELSSLTNGTYILRIIAGKEQIDKKFVVSK